MDGRWEKQPQGQRACPGQTQAPPLSTALPSAARLPPGPPPTDTRSGPRSSSPSLGPGSWLPVTSGAHTAAGPVLWTPGRSAGLGWPWSHHVPPWSRSLLRQRGLPAQLHGHEGVPGASESALHPPQALSSPHARPGCGGRELWRWKPAPPGSTSRGACGTGIGSGSCGLWGGGPQALPSIRLLGPLRSGGSQVTGQGWAALLDPRL